MAQLFIVPILQPVFANSLTTNLSVATDFPRVTLSWINAGNVTETRVLRSNSSDLSEGFTTVFSGSLQSSFFDQLSSENTYFYTIVAIDDQDNAVTSNSVGPIVYDVTPPSVPESVSITLNGSTTSLLFTPSDDTAFVHIKRSLSSDFDEGVVSVYNSTVVSSFDDTLDSDGTYYYQLIFKDAVGNESIYSQELSVEYDGTPPSTPAPPSVVKSGSDLLVSWELAEDVASIVLMRAANSAFDTGVSTVYSGDAVTSFTDASLSDGVYYYRVSASDSVGNEAVGEISQGITIDTVGPVAPDEVSAFRSGSIVTLSWDVADDVAFVSVVRAINSSFTENKQSLYSGNVRTFLTDELLEDGTYYYGITVEDVYGNAADVQSSGPVVYDTLAPDVSTVSVQRSGDVVTVSWELSDDAAFVEVFRAESSDLEDAVIIYSGDAISSFEDELVLEGTYYYKVAVSDAFDNTAVSSFSEGVVYDITPPASPDPVIVSANLPVVSLSWANAEDVSNVYVFRTYMESDDLETSQTALRYSGSVVSSFDDQVSADGVYFYTVAVSDIYGNLITSNATSGIVYDTTPPTVPSSIQLSYSGNKVTLSWTLASDVSSMNVYRSESSEYDDSAVLLYDGDPESVFVDELESDGVYYYFVEVVDSYGNSAVSEASESVEYDTTAPDLPKLHVSFSLNDASLSWSLAEDVTHIVLSRALNSTMTESVEQLYAGTPRLTYKDTLVDDGTYYYGIKVRDIYGNWSVYSVSTPVVYQSISMLDHGILNSGTLYILDDYTFSAHVPHFGIDGHLDLFVRSVLYTTNAVLGVNLTGSVTARLDDDATHWIESNRMRVGGAGTADIIHSKGIVEVKHLLSIESGSRYTLQGTGSLRVTSLLGSEQMAMLGGVLEANDVLGSLQVDAGVLNLYESSSMSVRGDIILMDNAVVNVNLGSSGHLLHSINHFESGNGVSIDEMASMAPILTVDGQLVLNGTLKITLNGATPAKNDRFKLFDPASATGKFDAFDFPDLPSHLEWNTTDLYTYGVVSVSSSSAVSNYARALNYPNPFQFDSGTTIGYRLKEAKPTSVHFFMSNGQEIHKMAFGPTQDGGKAGYNKISLSIATAGQDWPVGVYFYLVIQDGHVMSKGKLVVKP